MYRHPTNDYITDLMKILISQNERVRRSSDMMPEGLQGQSYAIPTDGVNVNELHFRHILEQHLQNLDYRES